ncbi:hypothetical protein OAJ94_02080 [Deltaproteobacteria bacterium]|nr:hypothetical protein [Deltaproteobacteria bacterium]
MRDNCTIPVLLMMVVSLVITYPVPESQLGFEEDMMNTSTNANFSTMNYLEEIPYLDPSDNGIGFYQVAEDGDNLSILYYDKNPGTWRLLVWNNNTWSMTKFPNHNNHYAQSNDPIVGDYFLWNSSLFRTTYSLSGDPTSNGISSSSETLTITLDQYVNGTFEEHSSTDSQISISNRHIEGGNSKCVDTGSGNTNLDVNAGYYKVLEYIRQQGLFDISENNVVIIYPINTFTVHNNPSSYMHNRLQYGYTEFVTNIIALNGTSEVSKSQYHQTSVGSSGNPATDDSIGRGTCFAELDEIVVSNDGYGFGYRTHTSTNDDHRYKFQFKSYSGSYSDEVQLCQSQAAYSSVSCFQIGTKSGNNIAFSSSGGSDCNIYYADFANSNYTSIQDVCPPSNHLSSQFSKENWYSNNKWHSYSPLQQNYVNISLNLESPIETEWAELVDNGIVVIESIENSNGQDEYWIKMQWNDTDADETFDLIDAFPTDSTQQTDSDNDGYGDSATGFQSDACYLQSGNSTIDRFGCPDMDSDGYSNLGDLFPNDASQWNDTDFDGFGDNLGGIRGDYCPSSYGTSNKNNTFGCPDTDFDGWADLEDTFPDDSSQWKDSDFDGFGDELLGPYGDFCPTEYGNSTSPGYLGCIDSDGDGFADVIDAFPDEETQWSDADGDGSGDNPNGENGDQFPSDPTQQIDEDGDGFGDYPFGNFGDYCPDTYGTSVIDVYGCIDTDGDGYSDLNDGFPNDLSRWKDSDRDGVEDSRDMFPFDPTQSEDRDGDGMGDNPMGIGADKFPDDVTQWGDIDGDGYGDTQTGTNPDAFITDSTQWADSDGDGYGDNPAGRLYDMFPNNPTQWEDNDGDGFGDNQSGTDADPYLNDFDNDGFNDTIDVLPKLASPGDLDNDGCMDENDTFPANARECSDYDGDGVGDNEDTDDDDDGWADTDEMRLGTDPYSSSEEPVETFELVMPGTAIGLGAWDLIGMLGGIPLGLWILSGLLTRNGRTKSYERRLFEARTEEELSEISDAYEWSLMWKMVGPHQALRLERIRSNLEFKFNQMLQPDSGIDQTSMVETSAPDSSMAGTVGTDGYEWMQEGGANWYRPAHTGGEWTRWQ